MSVEVFKTSLGGREISIEFGRLAKQASGAALVRMGDTVVLCTVCMAKSAKEGQDFFPLTVEFVEKTYAAGRIPGGYFKREGRLGEHEILTSRLIDRPIRPLFPEGFLNEVQVICTVLSVDSINEPDTLALIGASSALMASEIPFEQPVAGLRLGRIDGKFVLNPSPSEIKESSDMDVLIAGTESSIIMVEGGAKQVDEQTMLDGLFEAHKELQPLIQLQKEIREKIGKPKVEWEAPAVLEDVVSFVKEAATSKMEAALNIKDKLERYDAKDSIKDEVKAAAVEKFAGEDGPYETSAVEKAVGGTLEEIASQVMRKSILEKQTRIDGRDLTTVRPIEIELGVLPRAHGSALFTRGETQALVTATLGSSDDRQKIDALSGAYEKGFMLHYNFPPFSVGETKFLRGPSRRDVGHGNLAEGALRRVVPEGKDFPYTLRVVSEILESNGSSSMATVCGGSLAMMDAGVQIEEPVAGIAMGLIAEGEKMEVLTDILGDEDHLGDMDFKVTGTKNGITAFQLDTKISGISMEVMQKALGQAKDARLHILDKMNSAISTPRTEVAEHAPRVHKMKVRQSKIKDVIGPGGKHIRGVVDETGAKVDIEDDGTVSIFSSDGRMMEKAIQLIEGLAGEVEVGRVYTGQVRKIMDFGAFVNIAPGTDGLCHISELAEGRVKRVEDVVQEGDTIDVKVIDIDRQGRIKLSLRAAQEEKTGS